MEIRVERKWKKGEYTIGRLYINDIRFSESLEDPDRGLSSTMSEGEIKSKKIYGNTAIPTGRYEIKMTYSPKFANRAWAKDQNGKVPQIMDVKGFSGVRIHPFNTAEESLGCIACGRNLEKGKVLQATIYYKKLLNDYILPAIARNEKIYITIQ